MTDTTKIEWADYTWNPWVGCTKVSPACDHCYAESWAKRFGLVKWGNNPRRRASPATWNKLKKWNRASADFKTHSGRMNTVFTCSHGDFFDNQVPAQWRDDAWEQIRQCDNLFMLILTKRPQNIAGMRPLFWRQINHRIGLGVTVENQTEADRRIPHLLEHDCAVRYLSCEPMLHQVDLENVAFVNGIEGDRFNALTGEAKIWGQSADSPQKVLLKLDPIPNTINWVIAGGESGAHARPSHPDWFRSLRDQCACANVPFLFKQWGEWFPGIVDDISDGSGGCAYPDIEHDHNSDRWQFKSVKYQEINGTDMLRVGKKRAGRNLDGSEHNQFPDFSGVAR